MSRWRSALPWTGAGTFDLFTDAPTIDRHLFLFAGTDCTAAGSYLADDDDACRTPFCAPSGAYHNGLITRSLAVGSYTVVGIQCCASTAEVQSGTPTLTVSQAPLTLRVQSTDGAAVGAVSTVPEPGTWALLGTGLVSIAAVARRRRSA